MYYLHSANVVHLFQSMTEFQVGLECSLILSKGSLILPLFSEAKKKFNKDLKMLSLL